MNLLQKVIKNLVKISLPGIILIIGCRCEHIKIGYLETRDAIYSPDSMIVKSVLDETEDAERIKFQLPWQSTSIEGIQGTNPLQFEIKKIDCDNGHVEAVSQFRMVRKGIIELPWNHSVPPGKYVVSVRVFNEGYSHDLDSLYRVIVE